MADCPEVPQTNQYKRVSRYLSGETSHKRTSGPLGCLRFSFSFARRHSAIQCIVRCPENAPAGSQPIEHHDRRPAHLFRWSRFRFLRFRESADRTRRPLKVGNVAARISCQRDRTRGTGEHIGKRGERLIRHSDRQETSDFDLDWSELAFEGFSNREESSRGLRSAIAASAESKCPDFP